MTGPSARALAVPALVLAALITVLGAAHATAREAAAVRGGSSPALAPLLGDGGYLDTISAGAPVWYRIPTVPSQPMAATIVVGPAHDGREAEVAAQLHDASGASLVPSQTATLNQRGAELRLHGEAPADAGEGDELLLSVQVGEPPGLDDVHATSRVHDVLLAVSTPGDPPEQAAPRPVATPEARPSPPLAAPRSPAADRSRALADALPGLLVGAAVGGVAGFEVMRVRLRRRSRPRPAER